MKPKAPYVKSRRVPGSFSHYSSASAITPDLKSTLECFGVQFINLTEKARNEVKYKLSLLMRKELLEEGNITKEEHDKINVLKLETFSPELKELYV